MMNRRRIRRTASLLMACCLVVVDAGALRASSPYLYAGGAFPVVEFMAVGTGRVQPDFLFGKVDEYRMVNFYDKSDVSSRSIRHSYIEVSKSVREIVMFSNSTQAKFSSYAISCSAFYNLCEQLKIMEVPSILLYPPNSNVGEPIDPDVGTILVKLGIQYEEGDSALERPIDWRPPSPDRHVSTRTTEELKADIHLSFDHTMRYHIFGEDNNRHNPLSAEKRKALKSWLLLIHKTIPPAWNIHGIVKELINSFLYITKNKAYLLAILDTNKPSVSEYSAACKGHGDACGNWEMLHAVTVGVVEYNKMGMERKQLIDPKAALQIIHDFVDQFSIGEPAASNHLSRLIQECHDDEKCLSKEIKQTGERTAEKQQAMFDTWIQLPLWMSRAHSNVNMQLQHSIALAQGRTTTLEESMSAKWPSRTYCPRCWKDGKWNEAVVYRYLRLEYTQIESLSYEMREEIFGLPLEVPKPRARPKPTVAVRLQQSTVFFLALAMVFVKVTFMSRKSNGATNKFD